MHFAVISGIQGFFGSIMTAFIIILYQTFIASEPYVLNLSYSDIQMLIVMGFIGAVT